VKPGLTNSARSLVTGVHADHRCNETSRLSPPVGRSRSLPGGLRVPSAGTVARQQRVDEMPAPAPTGPWWAANQVGQCGVAAELGHTFALRMDPPGWLTAAVTSVCQPAK